MIDTIRQISDAIQQIDKLGDVLDLLISRICPLFEVDACTVFIHEEDKSHYVMMASSIQNYTLILGQYAIQKEGGLISLTAEQEAPLAIEDVTDHPNNVETSDEMYIEQYKAFLGIPIQYQDKVLGIIAIQQRAPRKFTGSEIASIMTLSSQLAETIANALETGRISDTLSSYYQEKRTLQLFGTGAVSGVAIGEIVVSNQPASLTDIVDKPPKDIAEDIEAFHHAQQAVQQDIAHLSASLADTLSSENCALFGAYLSILESNSFRKAVVTRIRQGSWVQAAVRDATRALMDKFKNMAEAYLRERNEDIADLGRRLLAKLQENEHKTKKYPLKTVLVGHNISASMLAEVPHNRLVAVVSSHGSASSHMAILAKALGIPVIVGANNLPLKVLDGVSVIVDGYSGHIFIHPNHDLQLAYRRLMHEETELQEHLLALKSEPAITKDNVEIPLCANIGMIMDLNRALEMRASGIGLYRTEVPYMVLNRFPSEEEQCILYRQLLSAFPNDPVVMRVLDVGGDKVLPYFYINESNPFLGWRGIRLLLEHPDIFKTQIRAMLKASEGLNNLHILLPMVSVIGEIELARELIEQEFQKLKNTGLDITFPKIGTMIEVPAAIYQIDDILALSDFISVGSNDLTQYLLAVDRSNSHVAKLYDSFHPAVIRALLQIVESAKSQGKSVSICGELASDPVAVILLIGIGFDYLSMDTNNLLKVKWVLRGFSQAQCRDVLAQVIDMQTGGEIRMVLQETLIGHGFGGLVRAGKY